MINFNIRHYINIHQLTSVPSFVKVLLSVLTVRGMLVALKSYTPYIFLFFISLVTVWQLLVLGYIPETPANDLAKHVASILNFKDAFFDGQYLPRLQLPPAVLPDLPFFQFYGSLTGYLCLPFLIVGFKPITSLTLGILLIRWTGAMAIYNTGKLLSANVLASTLAGTAYLLTPYIISNFYGRVAVPEATAHGVIAILLYGVIRLFLRADMVGVIITGLTIVALSLAHPIFLLYGCLMAALFSLFLLRGRFLLLVGCVFLGGLLLASVQWLPGFLYRNDFVSNFTAYNPFEQRQWTSFSGLIGLPKSLAEDGLLDSANRLYLTPGILTIPILIMLSFKIKDPLRRATFGCLLLSLLASYSPFDFWRFLPSFFWALQFPYRLLSFVALFTSIGLCLTLKNLRPYQWVVLSIVMLAQSVAILVQKPYSSPLSIEADDKLLKELFASQDYRKSTSLSVVAGDAWLLHYATPIYSTGFNSPQIVDERGVLLKENTLIFGISKITENFIRVSGSFAKSELTQPYSLWLGYSSAPFNPLDGMRYLNSEKFSVIFTLPNNARSLTIRCTTNSNISQTNDLQQNCPDIHLDSIEYLPANGIIVSQSLLKPTTLHIDGASIFPDGLVDLWFASPSSPNLPLTEKVTIGSGTFSSSLRLPQDKGVYMLVASRYLVPSLEIPGSQDSRQLSVSIRNIFTLVDGDIAVPFSQVVRTERNGYKRIFKVENPPTTDLPDKSIATVQLPMAFSSMIEVTQNDKRLITSNSIMGFISVQTRDLYSPFVARFKWQKLALLGTFIGFLILVMLARRARQLAIASCSDQTLEVLLDD